MATLQELLAQAAALDAKIAVANAELRAAQTEERKAALVQITELAAKHGIAADEITAKLGGAKVKLSKGGKVSKPAAIKYHDQASGATWTGRGLKPKWLVAALGAGKSLDDFKV